MRMLRLLLRAIRQSYQASPRRRSVIATLMGDPAEELVVRLSWQRFLFFCSQPKAILTRYGIVRLWDGACQLG